MELVHQIESLIARVVGGVAGALELGEGVFVNPATKSMRSVSQEKLPT